MARAGWIVLVSLLLLPLALGLLFAALCCGGRTIEERLDERATIAAGKKRWWRDIG